MLKGDFTKFNINSGDFISFLVNRDIQLMTSNELCEPGQREAYTMMRED